MLSSDRKIIKNLNRKEINEESLNNISFSTNKSFYEKLDVETKRDIIFLIKSGYDKKTIIKLYILIKPLNVEEAVNYLTKENGLYQHIFYNSPNDDEYCEICGEKKEMHINDNTIFNFSYNNSTNINDKSNQEDITNRENIKNKEEIEFKCKICEDDISEEDKIKNKCEQCNNYFCSECLYLHIKELIKKGKYALFCPACSFLYTMNKIEKILSYNNKYQNEIINLKKLLEKSKTKNIILSNPELMFCPIANCDGFAKKNKNKEYNICTMGHKFCIKCGELWHENGICKDEENVDELFEEYRKKYNLKNCPYCNIITNKNGGCNHITCKYCGKDWCWICQEVFTTTEEHYGNINSKCFGRMQESEPVICAKCQIETVASDLDLSFSCDHYICDNCFFEYLLENKAMIIYPVKLLNCIISGCKGYLFVTNIEFIEFIYATNNENLINKYKYSILFFKYGIQPFFQGEYQKYIKIYCSIIDFIDKRLCCSNQRNINSIFNTILKIIEIFFGIIFIIVFVVIVPIFFHFAIKDLYYCKFLPEIRKEKNNKMLILFIFVGEEILSLVFLFTLIAWHYIYSILFFPILFLVLLIRNLIYGVNMCGDDD